MGRGGRNFWPTMKHAAGLSALRALSLEGLSAECFISGALETLHSIIPSYRNLFDWIDAQGNLVRYYFEGPIDARIATHYFEEFHNRRESEVMPAFKQAIHGRALVRSAAELDRPEFFRSALYNEIWRPQGLHSRIEAIVRSAGGAVTHGSLVLYRAPGDPRFTREDEELLAQVSRYVAQGLERGQAAPGACADYEVVPRRRAVLSLGPQGELLNLSQDALKLLLLAHGGVTPEGLARKPRREDFSSLDLLWQQHSRAAEHDSRAVSVAVDNAWGRFRFESQKLMPLHDSHGMSIHIGIDHFEPLTLSFHRALDTLPLSPVQRDVCLYLVRGESQAEIARHLSVAISTVTDHVRKIYTKLDVHSAAELTQRVRAEATRLHG